jgi:4-hydroxybenzoate polyprenyltransferase
MFKFFRLIRFPNLLIVAATQYLLQYSIVIPSFKKAGLAPTLPPWQFALFVLTTMLIAAGGYIINDIMDYPSDLLNKPHKVIVNKAMPKATAWRFYFTLLFSGLAIALYLAIFVGNPGLVTLFPLAWGLLWLYSRRLKQRPLAGNLTVAFFCAIVAGIVLYAERNGIGILWSTRPAAVKYLAVLSGGYLWFAFSTNFIREVIKDLEDMTGDAVTHCRTIPIAWGERIARFIIGISIVLLIASLLIFSIWLFENSEWVAGFACLGGIVLPSAYLLYLLTGAKTKAHYSRLSSITKMVMAAGLLLLILIWIF